MSKEAKREIIKEEKQIRTKRESKFKITQVVTKKRLAIVTVVLMLIALVGATILTYNKSNNNSHVDPELLRAMTYEQFEEGSNDVYSVEGETKVDNVKFSAFFLRDLDGDGDAEKIKGTCKQIGKQDTLYMEINILTGGMLKNGKIEIDGKNFNLMTNLPKDNQIKNNVIGTDISEIEFNDMTNGTQKLLTGVIRSGNYFSSTSKNLALGNNTNNYTRNDNRVILTGTYVDGNNNETEIRKEIDLTVDWYGNIRTTLLDTYQDYRDLESKVNEETNSLDLSFKITTNETEGELLLKNNHIEATIPEFNGIKPIDVRVNSGNTIWEYNEETGKLTIDRNATVGENGNITLSVARVNTYNITVRYPLSAYESFGEGSVELLIPIEEDYKGYNNQNSEFTNPKQSNTAKDIIRVVYTRYIPGNIDNISIDLGEYISNPYGNYVISKNKPMKIYNGLSNGERNDNYTVRWYYYRGSVEVNDKIIMKETANGTEQKSDEILDTQGTYSSMEDFTTNKGISFSNLTDILDEENGEVKVFDDELGYLLLTIDKSNIRRYSNGSRFDYEYSVKHVRVEVTGMKQNASLIVYHIKELDDEHIITHYTEAEFNNLKQIKSNLVAYRGESLIGSISKNALYELPTSVASISIENSILSTQKTEKNDNIVITAEYNQSRNEIGWKDAVFLIKLPNEMIKTEINNVTPSTNQVSIDGYEYLENEQGKFIKVYTSNNNPLGYTITINCNLSPDPRIPTTNSEMELYAVNSEGTDYYYKAEDRYDVNNNENIEENINKTVCVISMVAPNSLLTNQTLSEFDDTGAVIVSPNLADISPKITNVETEDRTARIGVQVKNNYSSDITDVVILGKIPFEGNTTVLTEHDLGSTFTANITAGGITAPESITDTIDIYYSTNENSSKDLADTNNNWVKEEDVTSWDNIKTFLIDFKETEITPSEEYTFYYTIKIPHGLDYNEKSCSHHGIWFSIITEEGKYRTQTEPNETGIRIAEKYDVNLKKYQTGKDKIVKGAIYSITEVQGNELVGESKTALTNSNGILTFKDLYIEKTYEIKEIRSPEEYELNSNTIRFIAHVDNNGELTVEKLSGATKGEIITNTEDDNYSLHIEVEDEVKARLHIIKTNDVTNEQVIGARFKITGENFEAYRTTGIAGDIVLTGLTIGQEYTITEIKNEGYYLAEPIKVKIVNNNGTYEIQKVVEEGEVREDVTDLNVTENDSIPTGNVTIKDNPIPTYNLIINKIEKGSKTEENPNGIKIPGVKFRLYKGNTKVQDYETDENGEITITGLYQYEEERDIDQTYTLEEIYAPDGYAKTSNIIFKAQRVTEEQEITDDTTGEITTVTITRLQLNEQLRDNQTTHEYTINENTINLIVENAPSFKLIKKDGETNELLPNTKFAIYNVDGKEKPATNSKGEILGTKETINGKEYYILTTNDRGEITADLAEGFYRAVEIEADEKYDLSNIKKLSQYFGIGASRGGTKDAIIEWGQSLGGTSYEHIKSITTTSDGGFIVGGDFSSSSIDLGNGQSIINRGSNDGMLIKYNAEGDCEWGKSIGGSNSDYINTVIETSDGGYLIGGYFSGNNTSIDLGNGQSISNHGNYDGMLIKYNAEGECEWGKSIGGSISDYINAVIETSDEGFLVGGYFNSTSIDLENNQSINTHGSFDGMVIKYDRNGECEWGRCIGSGYEENITTIIETTDGGYAVGGYFESSRIDLGNNKSISNHGGSYSSDGMVIKYNRDGECEWGQSIGGTSDYEKVNSIIETSDGGYLVGGEYYSNEIDLGNNKSISNNGGYSNYDGMLIKYSNTGECEWGKSVGGRNYDYIKSVTEAFDGGYLVVGGFQGTIDLGNGQSISNHGGNDGMVIKYSKEGECEWGQSIGGTGTYEQITNITNTSDGGYLVGGYFESSIDLENNQSINTNGYYDVMIIKIKEEYISDEIVKWGKSLGDIGHEQINSITETTDGGYLVGGYFESSRIDLGNNKSISNHGGNDGMLIKYSKEGECEWGQSIGGTSFDSITSIIETKNGGYVVVGDFSSSSIDLGNNQSINTHGYSDGMLIKYSNTGECEWAKSIGGEFNDNITSVFETLDGGFLVGGHFESSSINLGNDKSIDCYETLNGMVIKYNSSGECEWGRSIRGTNTIYINSIIETTDGGYLVGGRFSGDIIELENDQNLNNHDVSNQQSYDGMVIKYSSSGEYEWGQSIGGTDMYRVAEFDDCITSIIETTDGGYLAVGYFYSQSINLGNNQHIGNHGSFHSDMGEYIGSFDGMIIKYNSLGECEWGKSIGGERFRDDYITSVVETSDEGFLVGGRFYSNIIDLENDNGLINNGSYSSDGMVIKYNRDGECEWGQSIGDSTSNDSIESIVETIDGGCVVGGYFENRIDLKNGQSISSHGNSDGMVIKINRTIGVPEQEEITFTNIRKKYQITTDIKEIDNIKGGTVSGEDFNPYEIVKYGDTSIREIQMIPDENYEIIGITVNGEEWQYETEEDGSYTMPQFTNVTEDKHIVVTYSLKDNKIIINKEDRMSGEKLEGAEFILNQIEERTDPVESEIIGDITANGTDYNDVDFDNEITDRFGELTNNDTYYFVEQDGKYIPTNSKTYQVANGGSRGVQNSYARSYIPLDLTGLTGKYKVVINASISSQSENYNYDYGYVNIGTGTYKPDYYSNTPVIYRLFGEEENKSYISQDLNGGTKYYIHLGYCKNGSTDIGDDQIVINSIKLYGTKVVNFNFEEQDGKYVPTNQARPASISNSYIPIDLTNYTGTYTLTVNAEISSENYYDQGYATVSDSTTAPSYSTNNTTNVRFIIISGEQVAQDYTTLLQGGKQYYLHLGYYKNGYGNEGNDCFIVNSIHISLSDAYLYHTTAITNSQGQAITQIPFGKYAVIETKAPDGYYKNEDPTIIEFRNDEGEPHEFTITNNKKIGKTIVHHYIKDTTISLAEDDIFTGKIKQEGETILNDELDEYLYESAPYMDFDEYELEKDENGKYIVPDNANGLFTQEDTIVTYYYVPKQVPITVHHYIEGTETGVPLANGTIAEDEIKTGNENEEYQTTPIEDELLAPDYELAEIPDNAVGTYQYNETEVIYYYKKVRREVTINKYQQDGITPLEGAKFNINITGEITDEDTYTTNENGQISLILEAGTYKLNEVEAPEGYEALSNIEDIVITKETNKVELNLTNERKKGTVTVHHYIEGTTENVPSQNGGVVENEIKTNDIGERYATKASSEVSIRYYYVSSLGDTSGEFIDGNIDVIYNYKLNEKKFIVEYYYDGVIDDSKTDEITAAYGDEITTYEDKVEDGYMLDHVDGIPLTVTENEETNIIKVYYVPDPSQIKGLKYTIEYYINGDIQNEDTEEVTQTVQVLQPNTLEVQKDDINTVDKYRGYKLEKIMINDSEEPIEELPDTVNNDDVIKVYYVLDSDQTKEIKYTVEYYKDEVLQEEDTQVVRTVVQLLDGDTLDVNVDDINVTDKYEGYTFEKTIPARIPNIAVDGEVIKVYYVKTKYPYTVEYYYNNVKDNTATETGEAHKDDIIEEYTNKPKEGYEFEEVEGIPLTISDTEPNVIKVYYLPIRNITVEHIDKNTGEILDTEEKHGKQGNTVTTSAKDIDNYMLVESPETEEYTYTEEDQTVKYYYAKVSSGVLEKHLDLITGNLVAEDVFYEGYEGKLYSTSTKKIEGYNVTTNKELYQSIVRENPEFLSDAGYESLIDFFEETGIAVADEYIPENAKGEMEEELITVRYYYTPIIKLIVKYKDILTGTEIEENVDGELVDSTISRTGNMDDPYTTVEKTFEDYLTISNKTYYRMYLTNNPEVLEEAGVETIDEYLEKENIDPKAPYLPENSEGLFEITLNEDGTYSNEITVTYFYGPEREVTVKYYDKNTGEEISEETVKVGPDGDTYDLTDTGKEIEGYTLVEEPEEPEGVYQEENPPRNFYYAKNTQVKVQYVDKDTKELIDTRANYTIDGYVGKEYETEKKKFDNYNYVSDSKNTKGDMTEEPIEVIYYYSKQASPAPSSTPTPTPTPEQQPTPQPKTNNTKKTSIIKRIVNPKTGDMVPVVAYSTIFVVLAINIMLIKHSRKQLARVERTSRINRIIQSDRAQENGKEPKKKAWVKVKKAKRAK